MVPQSSVSGKRPNSTVEDMIQQKNASIDELKEQYKNDPDMRKILELSKRERLPCEDENLMKLTESDEPEPITRLNWFERLVIPYLNDPRDFVFLYYWSGFILGFYPLIFLQVFYMNSYSVFLSEHLFYGHISPNQVIVLTSLLYIALLIYWTAPYILLLHHNSHYPVFRNRGIPSILSSMNNFIYWFVGPIFGQTPYSFNIHHLKMHHIEDNSLNDLSSTLLYQRDSFLHFLHYMISFLVGSYWKLPRHFAEKGQYEHIITLAIGEFSYFAYGFFISYLNWRAAIVCVWLPMLFSRVGMMSGNFAQHAFIDPDYFLESDYVSTITCINVKYNWRCWNDGYHTSHHLNSIRNWREHPSHLKQNYKTYQKYRCVIFDGLDFHMVCALLLFKQYGVLADHFVQLGPRENWLTRDEVIALLKKRTQQMSKEFIDEKIAQHQKKNA